MQQKPWSVSTIRIGKQIASAFAYEANTSKRLHDFQQEHKGENGSRYDDSCEHHESKNEILCLVLYVVHVSSDRAIVLAVSSILECQDSCRQVGYLLLKRFCDHDQRNTAKNRARANTKHPARSHSGIERLADFSQAARPSPTITTRARPEIRAWE